MVDRNNPSSVLCIESSVADTTLVLAALAVVLKHLDTLIAAIYSNCPESIRCLHHLALDTSGSLEMTDFSSKFQLQ